MKNFKRISSLIVALVMIVATMSAMFVTASAADVAAGTTWSPSNINTGVVEDGPFKIYGLNNATNEKLVPSSESVVEWGTWRHKVTVGETQYIAYMQPEKPDLTPDFNFGFNSSKAEVSGLLVFTAPVSGTYSLEAIFVKLYGTNNNAPTIANISVYKNGTGDALASVINQDYTQQVTSEEVDASVASVELAKDDELWIVVSKDATSTPTGGYNVQVKDLKVTLVSVSSAPSTPALATYTMDCALAPVGEAGTKTVTDNWELAAIKKGTSNAFPVDTATKVTWGSYYGVWPNDPNMPEGTKYTHSKTEKAAFAVLDIVTWQAVEYDAAIIFTAPESGEYSFNTKLMVISADYNEVANTVYVLGASEKIKNDIIPQSQRNAEFTQEGTVTLKKGDKLVFAAECTANTTAGKANRTAVGEITVSLLKKASTPSTPSNPTTGDALVVSFAVAVVAGVAIVASKKRR